MKLINWSIHKTADAKGLALKPPANSADYEVCVAVRNDMLEINVYLDGTVLPIARMQLPATYPRGKP